MLKRCSQVEEATVLWISCAAFAHPQSDLRPGFDTAEHKLPCATICTAGGGGDGAVGQLRGFCAPAV